MSVIPFTGEMNAHSVERLIEDLKKANASNIVYIDSPGGSFDFFFRRAPFLQRRGLITIAGDVRSAAVLLYLLGYQRFALPDSTFFFHEVRALVGSAIYGIQEVKICNLEEVLEYQEYMHGSQREFYEEWLIQMRKAQEYFLNYLSRATGCSVSFFLRLMREEVTLSAQDAMRYGIVHRIISEI